MTDQISPPIKAAEDFFKSLVWDVEVSAILTALNLNVWPLNLFLVFFSNKLYEAVRLGFDLTAISFANTARKNEFEKSVITLKIIDQDFGPDSEQYKTAKENAKDALSKFASYGAAA